MKKVEIITVHYQTPQVLLRLLQSIESHEGNRYPIRIIDGSERRYDEVEKYIADHQNINIEYFDCNIHHGPGLNYGISTSQYQYVFIVDTDMVFLKPVIEIMLSMIDDHYGVGRLIRLNESIALETDDGMVSAIKYLHPGGMLINRDLYPKFYPFIKHGAPCILAMADIHLQKKVHLLIDFPEFSTYIQKKPGGTREKHGSCLLGIPHRSILFRK